MTCKILSKCCIINTLILLSIIGERGSKMAEKREKAHKPKSSTKAAKPYKAKKKMNWILYIAVVALVIYIAVIIVDQNVKIQSAKEELSELDKSISLSEIKLAELKDVANYADKDDYDAFSAYIERKARELDYVKSGEVVYINIAGD